MADRKTRRLPKRFAYFFLACATCLCSTPALLAETPQSPNFLLILTDDQSWASTSTLMDPSNPDSRSDYYKTPNMDALMQAGVRFSRGYVPSTYCTPTRRCLQVGQTTLRHMQSNAPAREWTKRYNTQVTLPRALKRANPNYQTAHFGKWHLMYDNVHPEQLGYDVSDGDTDNGEGDAITDGDTNGSKYHPGVRKDPKRIFDLTRRTGDFIETQVNAGKPFFVQLSHYAVHLKVAHRAETLSAVKGRPRGTKHTLPPFAAMIEDMDAGIGKLMQRVETLGVRDNTYIILLSDNGGRLLMPIEGYPENTSGQGRNYPLSAGKHSIYEGGIRVPFIIAGPGIQGGTVSKVPVSAVDLLPTLPALAGHTDRLADDLDGGSLHGVLLRGEQDVQRDRPYLVFHDSKGAPRNSPDAKKRYGYESALIQGDLKLIKFWGAKPNEHILELYNVATDPGEMHNLAAEMPEVVQRMNEQLDAYVADVNGKTTGQDGPKKLKVGGKKKKAKPAA